MRNGVIYDIIPIRCIFKEIAIMRLTTNKTSKGITYYIIRSVRRDGKRSSEVVERLGTETEIMEKYHGKTRWF